MVKLRARIIGVEIETADMDNCLSQDWRAQQTKHATADV